MTITFEAVNKRIVLGSALADTKDVYSEWKQWWMTDDNAKYLPAFRVVGGDPLSSDRSVPTYLFLENGWRIRPMESNHTLHITGGQISVDGGGDPVVSTIGNYNVLVDREVPVAAIGVNTSSGSGGITELQMRAILADVMIQADIKKVNGITVYGSGTEQTPWGPNV